MSPPPSPDPFALLSRPEVSSSREQLVEYLILSELLQDSWLRRREFIEVLRADVDAAGYDLLLECGRVARHVQLKSSVVGGSTKKQKVHTALAQKPSGCMLWAVLTPAPANRIQLEYFVFGGKPSAPLPKLDGFPVALHTKRNALGVRTPRPGLSAPGCQGGPVHSQRPAVRVEQSTLSAWLSG